MKYIIDRKIYDTDKMEHVHSHNNGLGPSDFNYLYRDLYLSKKGAWLLVTDSGVAHHLDSGAKVLDASEVIEYLESHEAVDQLLKHFSDDLEEG